MTEVNSKPQAQGQASRLGSQRWECRVGKIRMRTERVRMKTVWEQVRVDTEKTPQPQSGIRGTSGLELEVLG